MSKDKHVAIVAIICLTIMEIVAMFNGINGTMRTIIFMLIDSVNFLPNPDKPLVGRLLLGLNCLGTVCWVCCLVLPITNSSYTVFDCCLGFLPIDGLVVGCFAFLSLKVL